MLRTAFAIAVLLVVTASPILATDLNGKKVLFINSYHQGYAWSDGIWDGVQASLRGSGASLKAVYLDAKRQPSARALQKAADSVRAEISAFNPDVVIAADDAASQYVVVPHYKNAELPFVFCGVNWDVSQYGYPFANVTGMIQVEPIEELILHLSSFARGNRIGILTAESGTECKKINFYQQQLHITFHSIARVRTMAEWERQFLQMQSQVDILILSSSGGIADFDNARALALAHEHTQIPTGTMYDYMGRCALISYATVSREQGIWAAETARRILRGAAPAQIPVTTNKQAELFLNQGLARVLGVSFSPALLQAAAQVIE